MSVEMAGSAHISPSSSTYLALGRNCGAGAASVAGRHPGVRRRGRRAAGRCGRGGARAHRSQHPPTRDESIRSRRSPRVRCRRRLARWTHVWSIRLLPRGPGAGRRVRHRDRRRRRPAAAARRWNVAPTDGVRMVVERADKETGEITRQLRVARWGLVPSWAKDISVGNRMINARVESLEEKSAFARPFAVRRALLPADGYYEWKKPEPGVRRPSASSRSTCTPPTATSSRSPGCTSSGRTRPRPTTTPSAGWSARPSSRARPPTSSPTSTTASR